MLALQVVVAEAATVRVHIRRPAAKHEAVGARQATRRFAAVAVAAPTRVLVLAHLVLDHALEEEDNNRRRTTNLPA